jgi:hypothetical protein
MSADLCRVEVAHLSPQRGVVRVGGYLERRAGVRVAAAARSLANRGCTDIELDLRGVHPFTCSGVRGLLKLVEVGAKRGIEVRVRECRPALHGALRLIGCWQGGSSPACHRNDTAEVIGSRAGSERTVAVHRRR